jgi:hypothetical protein
LFLNEYADDGQTFVDPDGYPSGQFKKQQQADMAAPPPFEISPYDMDAVDPAYICTVFNPEDNMAR